MSVHGLSLHHRAWYFVHIRPDVPASCTPALFYCYHTPFCPIRKDFLLLYLCRSFDQLKHGQKYREVRPVIHISFLDYTLFKDSPEFYATYKLINVKNHEIYSDNFTLSVVNLSRTDLATEEDKKYQIDHWAKLFKATTWEEIRMLASKNDSIREASDTIFLLSAEANIRKRCLDREEYYRDIRTYNKIIAEKDALFQRAAAENAKKDALIQKLRSEIELLKSNVNGCIPSTETPD